VNAMTATSGPQAPATDVVYDVQGITLTFGGVTSLSDLSLQMHRGEILAIIGPNGAGKTSLFNSLTGVYTPQRGSITVAARPGDEPTSVIYEAGLLFKKTRSRKTHIINHLGVARTFQNIRLFPALTALENVKVGVETRMKSGPVAAMLGLPRQRREEREATERALELLGFVGLTHRANELAGSLAYGEQRRLEIARALGGDPTLLLLDEPTAGMNPNETVAMMALIRKLRTELGLSILLIEHDMRLVMGVTDRIVVLEFGKKIAEGLPAEIRENPAVIAAYLGVPEDDAA
jgi:branched-chain amino acid transport system ATP-binding protein